VRRARSPSGVAAPETDLQTMANAQREEPWPLTLEIEPQIRPPAPPAQIRARGRGHTAATLAREKGVVGARRSSAGARRLHP
jgi:hypothetical protein